MTQGQFPEESNAEGAFERQEDAFRAIISETPGATHPVAAGRYHLYVSLACPWAHRTVIARRLMGLETAIGMTVVDPIRDDRGWVFREGSGHGLDPVEGFSFLSEAYQLSNPAFKGRVTVPVLWDKEARRIVNNNEDDICLMFNGPLRSLGHGQIDWFPKAHAEEQAELSTLIYETVNNGVYQAGFATTQAAYEQAFTALFETLDRLEAGLAGRRFLLGDEPVESDWRLFCTLLRFDAVYHGHFKCNRRHIADYPRLQRHLEALYQSPGIAATVNMDHIKRHYYVTHDDINPTGIVPLGPALDWL